MSSGARKTSGLSRRHFLGTGIGMILTGLPLGGLGRARTLNERELAFHNLHTGENLRTTYWVGGNYVPSALADVNHVLRDFRTGDVKPIDLRLLDLLHALRERLGSTEAYDVISGYRSPKTNSLLANKNNGVAKKSLHMKGLAIDVNLPGRRLGQLRQAATALRLGGVGYYPKSGFVHLDVGRVRSW